MIDIGKYHDLIEEEIENPSNDTLFWLIDRLKMFLWGVIR